MKSLPPQEALLREPIVIASAAPEIDCGRFPVKREIGDWLLASADIFRDGHDKIAASLLYQSPGGRWERVQLKQGENDRWSGSFPLDRPGIWHYTFEAWTDRWASWASDARKKLDAGQSIALEASEGRMLIGQTLERVKGDDARTLRLALEAFDSAEDEESRAGVLLDDLLERAMSAHADRSRAVRYPATLRVRVDRPRARFAAWYEFFPRSQGTQPGVHGTLEDARRRLPEIAELGFDVVYLPPVHPIGFAYRKGRNNALRAVPGDVGSPYAIGSAEGGHTAIHPQLGTLEDFRRFVGAANELGMEVAMDYALQCSPDHPWVKEHPQWFAFRPDGTIKYAENPPKKYQDIVNFNFESEDAASLWEALRDVLLFWNAQGIKTFRVDNPHTKPLPFWEWVIAQVQEQDPDVIFLSEAFTRPKMMWRLAKAGFTQSYTYFTWRTGKQELTDYALELAHQTNEFLRPNFFANTPDILHRYLQRGGRPAFRIRLLLAATLSSLYGIYSGFELCEASAVGDSEEYLDSEKYEIRVRDWHAPGNILDDVRAINRIRRENAALHEFENIRFYPSNDESVIFYGKVDFHHRNFVFVAVNLDPVAPRSPALEFPTGEFGLDPAEIRDVFGSTQLRWSYGRAYTVLDPQRNPGAVFVVNR